MIAFRYYGTYGEGCEHFRFVRKGRNRWRKVYRILPILHWSYGSEIMDNPIMFFRVGLFE